MADDSTRPRHIDIAEFRALGYLQELNRQFLHPLGLALEVRVGEDGQEAFGGVWDYRDDPEGVRYEDVDLTSAAARIAHEWQARETGRRNALGYMTQPAT